MMNIFRGNRTKNVGIDQWQSVVPCRKYLWGISIDFGCKIVTRKIFDAFKSWRWSPTQPSDFKKPSAAAKSVFSPPIATTHRRVTWPDWRHNTRGIPPFRVLRGKPIDTKQAINITRDALVRSIVPRQVVFTLFCYSLMPYFTSDKPSKAVFCSMQTNHNQNADSNFVLLA